MFHIQATTLKMASQLRYNLFFSLAHSSITFHSLLVLKVPSSLTIHLRLLTFNKLKSLLPRNNIDMRCLVTTESHTISFIRNQHHLGPKSRTDKQIGRASCRERVF